MSLLHFPCGFDSNSTRERRLCGVNNAPSTGASLTDKVIDGALTARDYVFGLRWGKQAVDLASDVGSGWYSMIENAWTQDKRDANEKNALLNTMAETSRTLPPSLLQRIQEKALQEKPDLKQLASLLNHESWIALFKNPDYFNTPQNQPKEYTLTKGPEGVTQNMDAEARKKLYYEYVSALIPEDVRNDAKFAGQFGGSNLNEDDRKNAVKRNANEINAALEAMLGIDSAQANGLPKNIARASIQSHYGDIQNAGFRQDIIAGMQGESTITGLQSLQPKLGPSLLKGALDPSLEFINPSDYPIIEQLIAEENMKKMQEAQKGSSDVKKYTRVDRREKQRNAETIGETFTNLSGIEKLAALAMAAYVLSNKALRPMLGIAGVAYFSQKFILKQDDPINDVWAPMIRGVSKKITDGARGPLANLGITFDIEKYTPEEMKRRDAIASQFLSKISQEKLATSITGFTLLGDMSLSKLASNFVISKDGSLKTVKFWDKDFNDEIKTQLGKHGLDANAARKFFDAGQKNAMEDKHKAEFGLDPTQTYDVSENVKESGSGLATVFYMLAAEQPTNRSEVQIIEQARRQTPSGSYDLLPGDVKNHNSPKALYVKMVMEGRSLASGNQTTLFQHIQNQLPKAVAKKTEAEQNAEREKKFQVLQKEVTDYEYPKGTKVGFEVKREKDGTVLVDLKGTNFPVPLQFKTVDEFLKSKDGAEVVKRWRGNVDLDKRATSIRNKMKNKKITHSYADEFFALQDGDEEVRFAPQDTIFSIKLLPIAKTSLYKFMKIDDTDLLSKYFDYEDEVIKGNITPPADPL